MTRVQGQSWNNHGNGARVHVCACVRVCALACVHVCACVCVRTGKEETLYQGSPRSTFHSRHALFKAMKLFRGTVGPRFQCSSQITLHCFFAISYQDLEAKIQSLKRSSAKSPEENGERTGESREGIAARRGGPDSWPYKTISTASPSRLRYQQNQVA